MPSNIYYVYIYYDTRKPLMEPIYVGKGKNKRYKSHLRKSSNSILERKINHIREVGLEPHIDLVWTNLYDYEAKELEIELIKRYGRIDLNTGTLCNFTDGGDGTEGKVCSESTRQLFSQQRRGKSQTSAQLAANKNRIITKESCRKRSIANKGHRRHTPEQIEAIRQSNKNRIVSEETRKKFSETRLNHTPTKANYPPLNELIKMVNELGVYKVSLQLNITYSSLSKYLKRRGIPILDKRFKIHNHQSFAQDQSSSQ